MKIKYSEHQVSHHRDQLHNLNRIDHSEIRDILDFTRFLVNWHNVDGRVIRNTFIETMAVKPLSDKQEILVKNVDVQFRSIAKCHPIQKL